MKKLILSIAFLIGINIFLYAEFKQVNRVKRSGDTMTGTLDMGNNALTNIDWSASDDGSGSGLDADLLDSNDSLYFAVKNDVASATSTLRTDLTNETSNRISADNSIAVDTTTMRTDLNSEISSTNTDFTNVATDTTTIQSNLDTEISSTNTDFDNVATATATLRVDVDSKQAELSTTTWKAYDSNRWDGIDSTSTWIAADSNLLDNLDSLDFIKKDGSVGLSGNWDAGDYQIYASTIRATSAKGLLLTDDTGSVINGLFIENNGNIGIGTRNPSEKLTFGGYTGRGIQFDVRSAAKGGNNNSRSWKLVPDDLAWGNLDLRVSDTYDDIPDMQVMSWISDGNVGIGTSTPVSLLSVDGDSEFAGEMDLKSNKIVGVLDPTADQDAATKKYHDDNSSTDISWSYSGDLFNSTSTYTEGLFRAIVHATLVVGRYDIYIGSATTDAWDIVVSTKGVGGVWTEQDSLTVPANISTHTVTSSAYTLSENGLIKVGIEAIDASDPVGDISIKVGN